jgi:hypothetical protein
MSGHFYFWERRHSSPRERRLTLAQRFSANGVKLSVEALEILDES